MANFLPRSSSQFESLIKTILYKEAAQLLPAFWQIVKEETQDIGNTMGLKQNTICDAEKIGKKMKRVYWPGW